MSETPEVIDAIIALGIICIPYALLGLAWWILKWGDDD